MRIRPITKTIVIAALCATIAAAAGIASGAAQTKTKKTRKGTNSSATSGRPGGPMMVFGGGPVHADVVVLNKAGTAWITATEDNGKVSSVSGDQLAITEGTDKVPYKTVTLTIPADATVIRNGQKASLSDFKAGDRVHVSQSTDATIVIGGDKTMTAPGPMGGHGPGHGPGPGGPHFGPPPGGGTQGGSYGGSSSDSGSSDSGTTTS